MTPKGRILPHMFRPDAITYPSLPSEDLLLVLAFAHFVEYIYIW